MNPHQQLVYPLDHQFGSRRAVFKTLLLAAMADDAGHYTPPPLVFDDEAKAVAQPLLAEHERRTLTFAYALHCRCYP